MLFHKKGEELPPAPTPEVLFKVVTNPVVPAIPQVPEKQKINFRYPLIEPYAYAHIYWDFQNNELVYYIEEPSLDESERNLLRTIEKGIEELINISFLNVKTAEAVIAYLEKNIKVLLAELGIKVTEELFLKIMYYVYRDFVGLNEIEPMMRDLFIEDIECNGVNTPIYIVHRKYRNLRTNIVFKDIERLTSFVEKLAQKCGKYISYANPLLDGILPDKSRINATYSQEISSRGPTLTIRRFFSEPWSPIKLMQVKTVSPEILAYLWLMVEYEANFVVIGGTGAGKTSFLNSMAFFIPPAARIVSIEDTHEINLLHENWLPSVTREATGIGSEGKIGEVDLFTLLKESFRQRPDYVIVGEIRGPEAYVLFQGAASGHPVACTMHAEDVETMVRRLETPPISLPPSLVETIDFVCVISQVKVKGEEVRRLKSVIEIMKIGETLGDIKTNTPFTWDPASDTFFFKTESVMFQKLAKEYGLSMDYLVKEFQLRTKLLMEMYRRNMVDHKSVQEIINAYYKTPHQVLKKFGII
ncbi:MAG: type II/IV secretion system ATPase subunit [Nanoarchaeota archaeon]